jgi:hypothetical protein
MEWSSVGCYANPNGRKFQFHRKQDKRIYLAGRGAHPLRWETIECFVYGQRVTKTIKTFLVTYRPAGGVIRVVIVKEEHGCEFLFCTDPDATPCQIVEAFADRAAIEINHADYHSSAGLYQLAA